MYKMGVRELERFFERAVGKYDKVPGGQIQAGDRQHVRSPARSADNVQK